MNEDKLKNIDSEDFVELYDEKLKDLFSIHPEEFDNGEMNKPSLEAHAALTDMVHLELLNRVIDWIKNHYE